MSRTLLDLATGTSQVPGLTLVIPGSKKIADWTRVGEPNELGKQHGLTLLEQTWKDPSGKEDRFTYCKKAPGATVLPITPDQNLVGVIQFKQGQAQLTLEWPAGMFFKDVSSEEEMLAKANTELEQETGYKATRLEELSPPLMFAARKFEAVERFYVAHEVMRTYDQSLDAGEREIAVVELTPRAFYELWREGLATSATAVTAFNMAVVQGLISIH